MLKGKNLTILIIVIVFIIIVLLWMNKNKKSSSNSGTSTDPIKGSGNTNIFTTAVHGIQNAVTDITKFPLKQGSHGTEVSNLQTYLNSKGADLATDGIFGNATLQALKQYTGLSQVTKSDYDKFLATTSSSTTTSIGKTVYALKNGVRVYESDFKTYNNVYKTANKDEWIGVVSSIDNVRNIYLLGGDYYTPIPDTYVK